MVIRSLADGCDRAEALLPQKRRIGIDRKKCQAKLTGLVCGNSSVGRAQPCQGWGREFESRFPLQLLPGTPARPGFFVSGQLTHRKIRGTIILSAFHTTARWQSGHAAACKAVYLGSIPGLASTRFCILRLKPAFWQPGHARCIMPGVGDL